MAIRLDTHAVLWWLAGDPRLSLRVRDAVLARDRPIAVSAASAWEIATQHRLGRLAGVAHIVGDLGAADRSQGFSDLPVTLVDAALAGSLEGAHGGPFDRMPMAQALARGRYLASDEAPFDATGVRRLWRRRREKPRGMHTP